MTETPTAETTSATTALHDAVEQARVLTDYLVRLDPDTQVAPVVAERLAELVRQVAPYARSPEDMVFGKGLSPERYLDRSPVTGALNPIAPPLHFSLGEDGRAATTATLGLPYQGPPGRVHGGFVATLLDHLMGCAAASASPAWSYTRTLTVDYDLGVPLFAELVVSGQVERVEGRKLWVTGEITCDGTTLARAHGLWVSPRDGFGPG
ncbi:MAG: PaaI family thioesterase, partial [Intrasporangium sp.]|uniref:PaaI family thioesterase n=1 Tax=Intrasporangium sp. TaxID=1925024 RepID=UPI0026490987